MSGRAKAFFTHPDGRKIVAYEFGGGTMRIAGPDKPRIQGMNNDTFASEQEMLVAYDDTGMGADLFRVYEDGSMEKLRPCNSNDAGSAKPANTSSR